MTTRDQPVIDFPMTLDPKQVQLAQLVEMLRRYMGKVVSLMVTNLLQSHGGLALVAAAAPGTVLAETLTTLDLADAGIDQVRLVGRGSSTVASQTVVLNDVTGSTTLATVTLPTVDGRFIGPWTSIPLAAGDRAVQAAVIGNGVGTQTLYRLDAQWRTLHRA